MKYVEKKKTHTKKEVKTDINTSLRGFTVKKTNKQTKIKRMIEFCTNNIHNSSSIKVLVDPFPVSQSYIAR